MNTEKVKDAVVTNTAVVAASAAIGALTKHVTAPPSNARNSLAMQVGSAIGAAAAGGAGLSGSLTAGAAVVTAKVAVAATVGVALLPYIVAGGAVYGICKWLKKASH